MVVHITMFHEIGAPCSDELRHMVRADTLAFGLFIIVGNVEKINLPAGNDPAQDECCNCPDARNLGMPMDHSEQHYKQQQQ
jgi:hypothetical protein